MFSKKIQEKMLWFVGNVGRSHHFTFMHVEFIQSCVCLKVQVCSCLHVLDRSNFTAALTKCILYTNQAQQRLNKAFESVLISLKLLQGYYNKYFRFSHIDYIHEYGGLITNSPDTFSPAISSMQSACMSSNTLPFMMQLRSSNRLWRESVAT